MALKQRHLIFFRRLIPSKGTCQLPHGTGARLGFSPDSGSPELDSGMQRRGCEDYAGVAQRPAACGLFACYLLLAQSCRFWPTVKTPEIYHQVIGHDQRVSPG